MTRHQGRSRPWRVCKSVGRTEFPCQCRYRSGQIYLLCLIKPACAIPFSKKRPPPFCGEHNVLSVSFVKFPVTRKSGRRRDGISIRSGNNDAGLYPCCIRTKPSRRRSKRIRVSALNRNYSPAVMAIGEHDIRVPLLSKSAEANARARAAPLCKAASAA